MRHGGYPGAQPRGGRRTTAVSPVTPFAEMTSVVLQGSYASACGVVSANAPSGVARTLRVSVCVPARKLTLTRSPPAKREPWTTRGLDAESESPGADGAELAAAGPVLDTAFDEAVVAVVSPLLPTGGPAVRWAPAAVAVPAGASTTATATSGSSRRIMR